MPRQLAIFFPNGRTEYWLTTRTFAVGDAYDRGGERWIVTSITTPSGFTTSTEDGDPRHATITLGVDDT
jgi:hypothetical protein